MHLGLLGIDSNTGCELGFVKWDGGSCVITLQVVIAGSRIKIVLHNIMYLLPFPFIFI